MPRLAKPSAIESETITLEPEDNERLANLCGPFDEHLREVELRVGVEIANRGNLFKVSGAPEAVRAATRLLKHLYKSADGETLTAASVHLAIKELGADDYAEAAAEGSQEVLSLIHI